MDNVKGTTSRVRARPSWIVPRLNNCGLLLPLVQVLENAAHFGACARRGRQSHTQKRK